MQTVKCFPPGYSIIRKDRFNGGGGVFLALSQDISFLELSITTKAEMIWAKITPIHGEPIAIGAFNRPPENNADPIEDLN